MRKSDLIAAGTRILRVLPIGVADRLALVVAEVCWLCLPARRRVILDNLRHTAPERSAAEQRRLGRATLRNLARCTIDFLRIPLMSREELLGLVDLHGVEHLDDALQRGNGAILLSAHLGNWELAGAYWIAKGYRGRAVAEDEGIEADTYRVYERYRSTTGMEVIPLSRAAVAAYDTLREGLGLALLGDRAIGRSASRVTRFCDGYRPVPIGAAILSQRAKAPIVVISLVLSPGGPRRYTMRLEPLLEPPASRADAGRLVDTIAARLSALVSSYPDQWFVFQPEWSPAPEAADASRT